MDYLSTEIEQENIRIRLLLKQKDNNKKAFLIVTNKDYNKYFEDLKPVTYNTFITASKNELKHYIIDGLDSRGCGISQTDYYKIIDDLINKIDNNITLETTLNEIDNNNFKSLLDDIILNKFDKKPIETETKEKGKETNELRLAEMFILDTYQDQLENIILNANAQKPYNSLTIEFEKIEQYNYKLADILEELPEVILNHFQKIINKYIFNHKDFDNLDFDIFITPRIDRTSKKEQLKNVKKSHKIGSLVETEATIKAIQDITPHLKIGCFECRDCAKLVNIPQDTPNIIKYPALCPDCGGRNFDFNETLSQYEDGQNIIIQEDISEAMGRPKQLNLYLTNDLTDKVQAGDKAQIIGVLTTTQPNENTKEQDFILNANNIKSLNDNIILDISPEDIKEFEEISKKPNVIDYLAESIAPTVKGCLDIKKGLLCALLGAGETHGKREQIHILIIGDPGTAKTQLKEGLEKVATKYISTEGSGASTRGLTATVTQNKNNQWTIEAGAFPLANNGYVFIDEIDKIPKQEQSTLNSALESGLIYVNRAGLNATLKANTGLIGFGNPKNREFDPYKNDAEQLQLLPDLKSRMDLIFILKDKPDKEKDKLISSSVLNDFLNIEDVQETAEILENSKLKKYIYYAKQNFKPVLNNDLLEFLNEYYINMMFDNYDETENIKGYAPRHLAGLMRIAGAIAKAKLKHNIEKEDIKEAIKIQNDYLTAMGLDPETNKIDMDKASGISTTSDKRIRKTLKQLIINEINKGQSLGLEYVERAELLELFKKETNLKETTFKNRLRELKNNNEIKINKGKIYLVYND